MVRCIALLGLLGTGCAELLGIEDLAGENDSAVAVTVFVDQLPAESIDVVGHRIDGSVSDHQITGGDGVAEIAIPSGGLVSVLIEISPSQFELRTWADLRDGDQLRVNAISEDPTIDAAVTLSDENAGGLASWRVSFRTFTRTGSGGLGSPLGELSAIGQDNLSDTGTISAVARLRSAGVAQATATVIDAPLSSSGAATLEFSRWTVGTPGREIDVEADLGIDGLIVVGEVRSGQFFLGEDYTLDAGEAFAESVLVDRDFAEVIGVGVVGAGGARLQTDYVDPGARSHTVELESLGELIDVAVAREPRPAVSWAAQADGDTDSVLGVVELFDIAVPDKALIWRVEADPRRGEVILPSFPEGLPVDPDDFAGFTAGQVRAVASSAHDGYRDLRTGGVALGGHMASDAPIIDVTGRVRTQSLELPPP